MKVNFGAEKCLILSIVFFSKLYTFHEIMEHSCVCVKNEGLSSFTI